MTHNEKDTSRKWYFKVFNYEKKNNKNASLMDTYGYFYEKYNVTW